MNTVEIDITDCRYVVVSGGVGGAKLALGMYRELSGEELLLIGNVGDDFKHWGLHISPDLDTLMYTLAGVADPDRGWGGRHDRPLAARSLRRRPRPRCPAKRGDGPPATPGHFPALPLQDGPVQEARWLGLVGPFHLGEEVVGVALVDAAQRAHARRRAPNSYSIQHSQIPNLRTYT